MSRNLLKLLLVSGLSLVLLSACTGESSVEVADQNMMPGEPGGEQVKPPNGEMMPPNDIADNTELLAKESLWEVKDEILVEHASNPMPVYWDEEILVLAYEYRAKQLMEGPSDKSRFVSTVDGESFEAVEDKDLYDHRPPAIEFADGSLRRFVYMPNEGGVVSLLSTDGGENFAQEEGLKYEIESEGKVDPRYFGVSSFFMDSEGGIVLLYNVTNEEGDIVVNRAYSAPGSEDMKFKLTDENILGGSLERDNFADPHTVVRSNGEIWLIVMHQTKGAVPPLGKQGFIYAYMSDDDGETFDLVGKLFDYDDFQFDELYSLNDPKIIEFPKGQLRVMVAAMIEDEESESGFTWVLVQAAE